VIASLEHVLIGPLIRWLATLGLQRTFLVAGTSITGLPLDACPSALESKVELCFLPTGYALGFVRGERRPLRDHVLTVVATDEQKAQQARERMRQDRARALVVLDPTRTLRFAPLEAAMVLANKGVKEVELLDDGDLDKKTLAAKASRVDVLHLIGHGDFNDANPYLSGMYLGARRSVDAMWTNGEIFDEVESPAGRLAVLSGCETGLTQPNIVSEEISLPAAFLAAGYAAVVGSRWHVDDLSTTLIMGKLHARWRRGDVPLGQALRDSRRWLRSLHRSRASALVRRLAARLARILPAHADEMSALAIEAEARLGSGPERPFADPHFWAPFFVSGDSAITADGVDRRCPSHELGEGTPRG
jgi:CHAT domain-containing protein